MKRLLAIFRASDSSDHFWGLRPEFWCGQGTETTQTRRFRKTIGRDKKDDRKELEETQS